MKNDQILRKSTACK